MTQRCGTRYGYVTAEALAAAPPTSSPSSSTGNQPTSRNGRDQGGPTQILARPRDHGSYGGSSVAMQCRCSR